MNQQAWSIIIALLASIGVFFLASGIAGWLGRSGWGKSVSLIETDQERNRSMSLAARLAQDISQALPIETDKDPIEQRLSQAGNPYDSPAHFFQRKFAYMVLFTVVAVVVTYFLNIPLLMIAGFALVAALFGLYAPDSEVNDRINKRREALRREMAFMLDRVSYALMAYGTLQEALARLGTAYSDDEFESGSGTLLPSALGGDQQYNQRMATLGTTLTGMGGGLFAEYLNRLATLLLSSAEERFGNIREELNRYYPSSPETQNFLDIVESGLRGAPMTEHLFELADSMISDIAQEQREAGMRATAIVVAAAGLILIPLLLVVGGPAFTLAISVFAP